MDVSGCHLCIFLLAAEASKEAADGEIKTAAVPAEPAAPEDVDMAKVPGMMCWTFCSC